MFPITNLYYFFNYKSYQPVRGKLQIVMEHTGIIKSPHPFPETKLIVNALNHNLSRTLEKVHPKMGAKIPQKAIPIGGYFLRLIMGIKITHLLSVLQPKVIIFTKGYLKNGTTTRRSSTPVIVRTRYSVLRFNYLTKNGHIISLLSYRLNFFYYIMCNGKIQ